MEVGKMENPEDFPESDLSPGFSIAALYHSGFNSLNVVSQ
jgi:hypothetical protein